MYTVCSALCSACGRRGASAVASAVALTLAPAGHPLHERRTAKALYAEIGAAGYDGGYTRVTDHVRAWRRVEGHGAAVNAFVPLAFELGEAYRFDSSEEGLVARPWCSG